MTSITGYIYEIERMSGGNILFLDKIPLNTSFGVDLNTFQTGNLFKGVKMIPNGVHLIHYGNELGLRFFFLMK